MKTPEQIAADIVNDNTAPEEWSPVLMSTIAGLVTAGIEADRAQRAEYEAHGLAEELALTRWHHTFAPEGEPDSFRDLWNENMPHVSGHMYFAIPGEQPLHVTDEQAHHIMTYLSEENR